MPPVTLAFSPCPNDTFIFDAMVHHKIDTEGIEFRYRMADVEELNHLAFSGLADMVKVSYHAWLCLRESYTLLDSGSAMGFGNGPLLIAKQPLTPPELESLPVAVPGEFTTANLLMKIIFPGVTNKRIMVFNEIENAVLEGVTAAGVIIHENRFTYQDKGLVKITDLGEQWEHLTGGPIPLGAIVVKKDLGSEMTTRLNRIMRRSVEFALADPGSSAGFVKENAQEMDDGVMKRHIRLYVNQFTIDMGDAGKAAVTKLIELTSDMIRHG